jgi:hypothetical protein
MEEDSRPSGHRTNVPPLGRGGFSNFFQGWDGTNRPGGFSVNFGIFPVFPFGFQMVFLQLQRVLIPAKIKMPTTAQHFFLACFS